MVKTKKIHPGVRQNATDWEHTEQYRQMLNELTNATNQVELTSEALSDAYMAYDNLGWAPLNGQYENGRGVPLRVLHDWTDMNQQLAAINPLIKRAVRIRVSNIFGEGIEFTDTRPRVQAFIEQNADLVFSPQAYEELETALATDGNVFFLLDKINKEVTRIPFREITNVAVKPGSIENKLYFERTWVESTTLDGMDGTYTKTQTRKTWYPAPEVLRTDLARRIRDVPVDGTKAVLHISVNKQIGWTWGVPDIQPVIFWAKAYKEYLESNYTLVRALAKFTWKVTNTTPAGTRRAAAKLATPATMDPRTGLPLTAGAAVVTGDGDLTAINKAGANVNFDAGRPLAAMVAAGLEVNLDHLIRGNNSAASTGEQTLDPPTLKAMASRQALVKRGFKKMFTYFGFTEVEITFPPIQSEPIHRTVQAVVTALSTNALWPEEGRQMLVAALRSLGITNVNPELPEDGRYAKFVAGEVNENPATSPQQTPDASKTATKTKKKAKSPAGPMADGDHDQRKSE